MFQPLYIGELAKGNLEIESSPKIQATSSPWLAFCHFPKFSRSSLNGKDWDRVEERIWVLALSR